MHKKNVDAANASGEHLISEVLDEPAVTQQDLRELSEAWENICQLSVGRQERLDEALRDAIEFEEGYSDLVDWIDAKSTELQSQLPPDEDASVLQQQIEDHKVNHARLSRLSGVGVAWVEFCCQDSSIDVYTHVYVPVPCMTFFFLAETDPGGHWEAATV